MPAEGEPGSSPLTRGSVLSHNLHDGILGFIPAYAGFCSADDTLFFFGAVHPRLRGVLKAKHDVLQAI